MVRLLLIADTHVGFDHPRLPRVERPRRGPEVLAAFREAMVPARQGEVDLVVHGGDLFHRSKPRATVVQAAFEPLLEVADAGVPVVLAPGNHERSSLPMPLLASHPNLWVLDRPRTVVLDLHGAMVGVGGFPCVRYGIRTAFSERVAATGLLDTDVDLRLLVMHQTVEGAIVGPSDYVFRGGPEVIPGRVLPRGIAAAVCGHIHRRQRLDTDLAGRPLPAPVLYPGSIRRISFSERDEPKGCVIAEFVGGAHGGRLVSARFVEQRDRPMVDLSVEADDLSSLERRLEVGFRSIAADAVVRVRLSGAAAPEVSAARLRELAPPTMIVESRRPGKFHST